ncbi:hypothetical protein SESBI_32316 [Sesbania bispinosa]|nr:hypothetical protein SESBI_32316 [Sesbania bispinosa]
MAIAATRRFRTVVIPLYSCVAIGACVIFHVFLNHNNTTTASPASSFASSPVRMNVPESMTTSMPNHVRRCLTK